MTMSGMNPDTSGNRCPKPDPRYPTRLSIKVLISKIAVYSILTVQFSSCAQFSWCQSSENCCPINPLATTRHISLNKADFIVDFIPIRSASGKLDPDPVLISAYIPNTRPDTDFLCLSHSLQ